jgi:hypothetical protein
MKTYLYTLLILIASIQSSLAQEASYKVWYETGDGNFANNSFVQETDLNYYISSLPTNGGILNGFQKIVIVYNPIPPKVLSVKQTAKRTGVSNTIAANNLTILNGSLSSMPSTSDFIANDTIQVALHYNNKTYPKATKVGFFYNSNANTVFKKITTTNSEFSMPEQTTNVITTLPQVRTFIGENYTIANGTLLNKIKNTNGNPYQNGLVFSLPSANATSNIFITLFTEATIATGDNEIFRLVFLDKDNNILNTVNQNIINNARLKSHDPNYEKVKPNCLLFSDVNTKKANYEVHFQNTGGGPATTVKTTTKLPSGYTVDDIINWKNGTLEGISNWTIGGQALNTNYIVTANTDLSRNNLIILFERNPNKPAIVSQSDLARHKNEVLIGTNKIENPLEDKRTMGDFTFQLQLKTPTANPIDLESSTAIKFDDNDDILTNKAIIRIRNCCSCTEQDSNNPEKNTSNCKWKSKILQWLFCEDC